MLRSNVAALVCLVRCSAAQMRDEAHDWAGAIGWGLALAPAPIRALDRAVTEWRMAASWGLALAQLGRASSRGARRVGADTIMMTHAEIARASRR